MKKIKKFKKENLIKKTQFNIDKIKNKYESNFICNEKICSAEINNIKEFYFKYKKNNKLQILYINILKYGKILKYVENGTYEDVFLNRINVINYDINNQWLNFNIDILNFKIFEWRDYQSNINNNNISWEIEIIYNDKFSIFHFGNNDYPSNFAEFLKYFKKFNINL